MIRSNRQIDSMEDRIFDFLDLSQRILTIIKHENAILQECGCLSLEAYLDHRNSLLKNYEENAQALIEASIASSSEDTTRHLLISELSAVKSAISDNTVYQFKNLENKISLKKGDQSWH